MLRFSWAQLDAKRDIVIQVLYAAHGAQPYSRRQSGCRCVPDYLHLQLLGAIALLCTAIG